MFHRSWPRNISDKERKLGYSPGKRLADAVSEALNSGKIVKATKRMYTFYLGAMNSWSAVGHFPPPPRLPSLPFLQMMSGLRREGGEDTQRGTRKTDGRMTRNATQ